MERMEWLKLAFECFIVLLIFIDFSLGSERLICLIYRSLLSHQSAFRDALENAEEKGYIGMQLGISKVAISSKSTAHLAIGVRGSCSDSRLALPVGGACDFSSQ